MINCRKCNQEKTEENFRSLRNESLVKACLDCRKKDNAGKKKRALAKKEKTANKSEAPKDTGASE